MKNEFVEYDEMFPAGEYYIGDLCYILDEKDYEKVVCSFMYDGQPYQYGKYLFYFANTAYGDGLYQDYRGNKYGVDSGIIGIINLPTKKMQKVANKLMKDGLASVITFDKPFNVDSSGGVFNFGHIEIDTAEENNDYWE